MKLKEIRTQSWGLALTNFYQCEKCLVVDSDGARMQVGYKCPICGYPTPEIGADTYFHVGISTIINTIQDIYFMENTKENNHKTMVALLFCTLNEVLLDNFLIEKMNSIKIPKNVQDRLLEDNLFISQRLNKVFPSLIGIKWDVAIKKINNKKCFDYSKFCKFALDITNRRNSFLHRGNKYAFQNNIPDKCIDSLHPLISMFVKLHNQFIHQHPKK